MRIIIKRRIFHFQARFLAYSKKPLQRQNVFVLKLIFGESAVSVAYAACSLARQIFESLRELQILLVGAGETIELVSRHLLRHGVKKLMIANRTLSRAEQLVETLASNTPIEVYSLDELQTPLNQADIVISSTGSPNDLSPKQWLKLRRKHANLDRL